MTNEALARFVGLARELAGRATASGPPPRGWPYLGLDHCGSTSLDQLAGVARHGIFRKYEQVVLLEDGLGAAARWVGAQLGCTAMSTTGSPREATAGAALTVTAGLGDVVSHLVGAHGCLPIRDGAVTHVWAMESLASLEDPDAALAEARRVVRPGGQIGAVELVASAAATEVADRLVHPASTWIERVRSAGFADVVCAPIDDASDQPSARVAAARSQMLARLAGSGDASLARLAESLRALTSARAAGRLRAVRILGRRP